MIQIELAPIWQEATQQHLFRELLSCMSLPGTIANLSRYLNGNSALVGVLATLLDGSVSFSDETGLLKERDRRLLQASSAPVEAAHVVIADAIAPPPQGFCPNLGTLTSPEQGATLVLQGQALGKGNLALCLKGAGILDQRTIALSGFHPTWFNQRAEWISFPLGIDLILVDATQVMALPRTTKLRIEN